MESLLLSVTVHETNAANYSEKRRVLLRIAVQKIWHFIQGKQTQPDCLGEVTAALLAVLAKFTFCQGCFSVSTLYLTVRHFSSVLFRLRGYQSSLQRNTSTLQQKESRDWSNAPQMSSFSLKMFWIKIEPSGMVQEFCQGRPNASFKPASCSCVCHKMKIKPKGQALLWHHCSFSWNLTELSSTQHDGVPGNMRWRQSTPSVMSASVNLASSEAQTGSDFSSRDAVDEFTCSI